MSELAALTADKPAASRSTYGSDEETSRSLQHMQPWEFPGWGQVTSVSIPDSSLAEINAALKSREHPKLAEWPATAICGNDILSSCLYVSGLVAAKAGKLAPVCLALVAGILYLYRFIYGEVVNAIPMNGGSYNVLLNTTSKRVASVAASLAILSYIATGVVSGTSACTYLASTFPGIPVVGATVGLLFFFAALTCLGISESAVVALVIFVVHTLTLATLCGLSVWFIVHNRGQLLYANLFETAYPSINLAGTWIDGDVFSALFFGTSTAMLGISGFESSSQFVQEQAPGVFPKTLRNMWWGVAVFNPLLSFLSLGVMPLSTMNMFKNTVLSKMALVVGGQTFETLVTLDAFIVLSGAVLTAYVGINGLIRRLASDRVVPPFLLHENAWRHTNHWILWGYFGVATSLVLVLRGDVETLSGVYTYAFLGLMTLFGTGCMLLKYKRAALPRDVIAPWSACLTGVMLVVAAFFGNLMGDPTVLTYFALYFSLVLVVVLVMLERLFLLRLVMYALKRVCPSRHSKNDDGAGTGAMGGRTIVRAMREIASTNPTVFFAKHADLPLLNKAILYARSNEQTSHLVVVHVSAANRPAVDALNDDGLESTLDIQTFSENVALLDRIYPKLKIDFVHVAINSGSFGPAAIEWVSTKYGIPKNMMFVKQPSAAFPHSIAALGGVRIITG
ncbi:hypothetical protein H310_03163 [Aphanomyces invadans]|uniref:Amino acid permease/ SLC12A domain-containing protein n=1 Tax=Aphanomyces invadans TaxID=157072 RepID=A0A024UN93_9STRA|nr:hypothetical protein H310_03163 [Aphanomyces invadans]ETW07093.1 hypothetical protein H310_03163 [Aphanomyces invadans]|eukprot:XP_008865168.1 hypothetical protein H310_03163 [Aphanomyces invadans]